MTSHCWAGVTNFCDVDAYKGYKAGQNMKPCVTSFMDDPLSEFSFSFRLPSCDLGHLFNLGQTKKMIETLDEKNPSL